MRRRSFPRRPSHLGGSSSTCPEKDEQWFRREVTIPHEATPLKELQRLSTLPIRSLRNINLAELRQMPQGGDSHLGVLALQEWRDILGLNQ